MFDSRWIDRASGTTFGSFRKHNRTEKALGFGRVPFLVWSLATEASCLYDESPVFVQRFSVHDNPSMVHVGDDVPVQSRLVRAAGIRVGVAQGAVDGASDL